MLSRKQTLVIILNANSFALMALEFSLHLNPWRVSSWNWFVKIQKALLWFGFWTRDFWCKWHGGDLERNLFYTVEPWSPWLALVFTRRSLKGLPSNSPDNGLAVEWQSEAVNLLDPMENVAWANPTVCT